jgi:hypothetical protein
LVARDAGLDAARPDGACAILFYVNYCINDLPALAVKQQILTSPKPASDSQR